MKISFLLFENFTALDVVGPYEVLSRLPNVEIVLVGKERKYYGAQHGLRILMDTSIHECIESDILIIPGGRGIDSLLLDTEIIKWILNVDKASKFTVSICSGSLLLAEAGLLTAMACTTHWKRKSQLGKYHVNVLNERFVQDGKYMTSAGVTAGIDLALYLASKLAGKNTALDIQQEIEYNPNPSFEYPNSEL